MPFASHPISGPVYLIGYALAFSLSLFLTLMLIQLSEGALFFRNFFKRAEALTGKDVNPFGGIAVIFSFVSVLWILYALNILEKDNLILFLAISTGVSMMMMLGLLDDIFHLPPKFKFAIQTGIAFVMYASGFQIERVGDLVELNNFSVFLTLLWIVGITNAVNLIDGIDGLASGAIFLACLTLAFVYLLRGIPEASFLAVTLGGSILGFSWFNFPPAKIILGDTGSLPLGFLVSLITLLPLNQGYTDEIYYLIPIITLLLPITDTSFAFFRRVFKGVSPFAKDADHFHHRLVKLGFGPTKAIFVLFGVCIFFDLTALIPVYNIDLIPQFVPKYFFFCGVTVMGLVLLLRRMEIIRTKSISKK